MTFEEIKEHALASMEQRCKQLENWLHKPLNERRGNGLYDQMEKKSSSIDFENLPDWWREEFNHVKPWK